MNFSKSLLAWFDVHKRDLPWRRAKDPYRIWVSEVMLQQTTVASVIPYYERWIRRFPTLESAARAGSPKILKAWQGLGYYRRALHLHKAARLIVKQGGVFPRDRSALEALPGFGPYTVSAVLSIAFDQRHALIDGNVRRLLMRLLALPGPADGRHDKKIRVFLETVLPQARCGDFNQALMELGATVCRPADPACGRCPLCRRCRARAAGRERSIPRPRSLEIRPIRAAVGVIEDKGRLFLTQRPDVGLLAGLWEFPGGKIEAGESPLDALRREFEEELGVKVVSADHLFVVRHAYTRYRVSLDVYRVRVRPRPRASKTRRWMERGDLKYFPVPAATARILERLNFA